MLNFQLMDKLRGNAQSIDKSGASLNIVKPLPPFSGDFANQKMRSFRQHLTDDGLPTDGTNQDMRVDGSTTNVDFYIEADDDDDLYITRLSLVVADGSMQLRQFGALNALTNGCALLYEDERGTVTLNGGMKTNFELYRLFGNTPTIYNNVVGSNVDAALPDMDTRKILGFQWGIHLRAGTQQKVIFRVKDDLSTGLNQMDCVAYGFTRSKD